MSNLSKTHYKIKQEQYTLLLIINAYTIDINNKIDLEYNKIKKSELIILFNKSLSDIWNKENKKVIDIEIEYYNELIANI